MSSPMKSSIDVQPQHPAVRRHPKPTAPDHAEFIELEAMAMLGALKEMELSRDGVKS